MTMNGTVMRILGPRGRRGGPEVGRHKPSLAPFLTRVSGVSTLVQIDRDGGGDAFENMVVLSDVQGLDLGLMLTTKTLLL